MSNENINILLVDDDDDIRSMVNTALGEKGYTVYQANNAETALKLLSKYHCDILLTDICLPGMDGFELLDLIKKRQPHIGVIMMTGYDESYNVKEALLVGAEELLKKPFDLDELYHSVEKTYWRSRADGIKTSENIHISDTISDRSFEQILLSMGVVEEAQLERARSQRRDTEKYLAHTLIRMGICKENEVLPMLAENLGVEYISLKDATIQPEAIEKVPAKFAHHYKIMPIKFDGATLRIATVDPLDIHIIDDMKLLLGYQIVAYLASEEQIMDSLKRYYGIGADTVEQMMDENVDTLEMPEVEDAAIDSVDELAADASIIKFVNQIFIEAYKDRATDIHIEPFEGQLRIRYRIDGLLYETNVPPNLHRLQSAIVSRIKIMASLNIAERRLPQDGRIKMRMKEADLDLRVSTLPTPYGETVNIRLLTANNELLSLNQLGYVEKDLTVLNKIITKPHGIILVTGPTGSGKSTTLYASLKKLNKSHLKIITIEDPIEYRMSGVSQIQVLPKIDLTFARALRSMLRHDPDVMMIGEIRDYETAEAAIRAALTGHVVFSTLHTNDAASSITRLIDMGIEPYLVSSSVECIIAQRLVRTVCSSCKTQVPFDDAYLREFQGLPGFDISTVTLYEGKGCDDCKGTGYRGRTVIYEIMVMSDKVREMVVQRVPANVIKDEVVRSQGMMTLKQTGLLKAMEGKTTVTEVFRVAQEEVLD
ncbi:MAG: response regulator [Candidatus Auribacter fodinae]|jgi:type II secretion system protein E|uniref:Response regulator n=1 Tax=Candidatus Auribacter fodinae TaxID=2093366 RepID=A0A3A4R733_9BACT|nr:MAG: response regulator [Candidatus Auribacter fodinae]